MVLQRTVNPFPLGKQWRFNSVPIDQINAQVMELVYILSLEVRFCGFESHLEYHTTVGLLILALGLSLYLSKAITR